MHFLLNTVKTWKDLLGGNSQPNLFEIKSIINQHIMLINF